MKKLVVLLCSIVCLQPACSFAESTNVTTVIVNNGGKTPEYQKDNARKARIFDYAHGSLAFVTLCTVAKITGSKKLGVIAAGLQLCGVAKRAPNKLSLVYQYGEGVGIMSIALMTCFWLKS